MQQADPFLLTLQKWMEVFMQRSMRDFARYARESGLSLSQMGALFQIRRQGSSGITDLGEHLGVSSSAASQLLQRLVQQELILRSEDPSDRRVRQVVLQEGIRARESWLSDLAGVLSDSEKDTITAALNILIDKAHHLGQLVEQNE
jgi:DNA-binding MarR family transcriptional regulator